MKKLVTGLVLTMGSLLFGHSEINQKHAIESIKARISMLDGKLTLLQKEEKLLEKNIGMAQNGGKSVTQLSLAITRLAIVKNNIAKLLEARQISENSLKPLRNVRS